MIGSTHRFHGHNSLRSIYQRGQLVRSPVLLLRFTPSERRDYRVAVVVSRKVHKSAVVRNRIRRRVYAIVQAHETRTAQDLVFTVLSDQLRTMPAAELQRLVDSQLKKAGFIDHRAQPHAIVKRAAKGE